MKTGSSTYTITDATYDANGRELTSTRNNTQFDANGKILYSGFDTWDSLGHRISGGNTNYDANSMKTGSSTYTITDATYDANGRELTSTQINTQFDVNDNKTGGSTSESVNTYDLAGHLLTNKQANIQFDVSNNKTGSSISEVEYTYDSSDRQLTSKQTTTQFDADDKQLYTYINSTNRDDQYIMEEVIGGNDIITDSSGNDELVLSNTDLELNGHSDPDVNRTGVNNVDLSISFYQHGVLKSSTTIIGQFATNTPVIEKFSNENDQRSLVFNNSLVGAAGNDFIVGSSNYDSLTGNAGDDYLFGGAGNDTLDGGDNDDTLFGELGDDSLVGGAGNDMLYAGYGNDTLVGGQGDDEYNLYPQKGSSSQGSSTIIENQNEGNDTIYISDAYSVDMTTSDDGKDLIISAILNGTLVGANTVKDQYKNNAPLIENYSLWLDGSDQTWQFIKGNTGTNANELIVGASVSDTLNGKDGSDWLFGGAGSDTIIGGVGNDTLTGGEGNDTFIFNVGDSVLLGINNPSNIIDVITDLNVGDKIDLSTIATSNNLNLITSGILAADFSGISDTTTNKIDVFFANLNQHFYLVYETTAGNDSTQGSLGVIDIGMSIVGSISNYTELNGIISFQSFTLT